MKRSKALDLFMTFGKIGLFTFGGGYAMIPLIQREVVDHKGWVSHEDILDVVAIAESTPGPIAINAATFIGSKVAGWRGAACATLGVVLPSFIVILIVAGFYRKFSKSRLVEGAMGGLRPTVIGLIAAALLSIGREVFAPQADAGWLPVAISLGIFAISALLAFKKKHPILIILLSAAAGIGAGYALGL